MTRWITRPALSRARLARVAACLAPLAAAAVLCAPAQAESLKILHRQEHRLQQQLHGTRQDIFEQQAAQQAAEDAYSRALAAYQEHIVELYQAGATNQATILLSATSLSDAIERVKLLQQVGAQDADLLRELRLRSDQALQAEQQLNSVVNSAIDVSYELDQVRAAIADKQEATQRRRQRSSTPKVGHPIASSPISPIASGLPSLGSFSTPIVPSSFGSPAGAIDAATIDSYLAMHGSPMTGQGTWFVLAGSTYGVDPRLLVAISGAESNFGSTTCAPFNAWGWGCPTSPHEFTSWADGIATVASGLQSGYLGQGLLSVAAIHQKYAPVGAANDPTGLNSNWVTNVTKFLVELGGNPGNVGASMGTSAGSAAGTVGSEDGASGDDSPSAAASSPGV